MALQADRQSDAYGHMAYGTTAASLPAGKRTAAVTITAKASTFAFTAQPSPRVERGDLVIAAGYGGRGGSGDASAAATAAAARAPTCSSASKLASARSAVSLSLGCSASSESFRQAPEAPSQPAAPAKARPALPPLRTARAAEAAPAAAAAAKEAAARAAAEPEEQRLAHALRGLLHSSTQDTADAGKLDTLLARLTEEPVFDLICAYRAARTGAGAGTGAEVEAGAAPPPAALAHARDGHPALQSQDVLAALARELESLDLQGDDLLSPAAAGAGGRGTAGGAGFSGQAASPGETPLARFQSQTSFVDPQQLLELRQAAAASTAEAEAAGVAEVQQGERAVGGVVVQRACAAELYQQRELAIQPAVPAPAAPAPAAPPAKAAKRGGFLSACFGR